MKNKIIKFIYLYLIYGLLFSCIFINLYSIFFLKRLHLSLDGIKGYFIASIIFFPVTLGLKEVSKEYIETWRKGSISTRLILLLGLIFVLYGVYYRSNR